MTKKLIIILLLIATAFSLNAQTLTEEESEVKKVLEEETLHFKNRDYAKWSAHWIHSESNYFTLTGINSNNEFKGWEAISKNFKDQFAQYPDTIKLQMEKTDYNFRINGDMAFVTFTEDGNASTRVLEKENGDWKILCVAVIHSNEYSILKRKNALENLAGSWKGELSNAKVPAGWNLTLKDIDCKITYRNNKLTLNSDYKFENSVGQIVKSWNETISSADLEINKIGVLKIVGGEGWGHSETGCCNMGKNGNLILKFNNIEKLNFISSEETFTWKSDNVLEVKVKMFSENNELVEVFSYDLIRTIF